MSVGRGMVNVIRAGDGDERHGTENGYNNHGCRCSRCRAAHSKITLEYRRRRAARLAPADPRHGRKSTYLNHACRCDPCRTANAAYSRQYRQTKADQ